MKPVFDENGLATVPGDMRCFYYNAVTYEYTGWSDEYINTGVSIPACSTGIDPGENIPGRVAVFTGSFKLYVVPFTKTQLTIYQNTPPEKMTILLKRAMLKAARLVAEKNKSMALVTGDSIGQVASQTMHAINAIDSAVTDMPVLRPLCAMDKQEIVDWARKIGTFDISIRPYEDCCTVFVAKHPETKPKKSIIENIERKIEGLDELIEQAVEESKIYEF